MARLWLHVGGHRTGSTSIQQTMAASRKALLRAGLVYPDNVSGARHRLGCRVAHHHLAEAREGLPRHLDAIHAHYRGEEYLVSSEGFETLTLPERLEAMRALRAVFGDVRVVYYLREPVGLAVSKAARQIKAGRQTFAEVAAKPPLPSLRRQVEWWTEAAGPDSLVLRVYDRARLVNGDVVDDILAVVGRDASALRLTRRERNASLSLPLALALSEKIEARRANGDRARWRRPRRVGAGPPFALPRASLAAIGDAAAADVAWLRETRGIVFPPSRHVAFEDVELPKDGPLGGLMAGLLRLARRG